MNEPLDHERAETLRKKHLYRSLILQGKLKLRHQAARRLVGPDCAYHLYHHMSAQDMDNAQRDISQAESPDQPKR